MKRVHIFTGMDSWAISAIFTSLSLSNNIHTFIMGLDLVEDVESYVSV